MVFSLANLPYWILLGMGLLFLFVIISGGGDAEFDGDLTFGEILEWVGIGKAPLIFLLAADLSLWSVFGLTLNTLASGVINGDFSAFVSGAILLISLIISFTEIIQRSIPQNEKLN
ncbi:OB-fold-containig protein [Nodularia sphaerocarpa]|uniref:OB-fold-containig protein n=1 Tax=Nodularia sphaerocarpa TaxID=137816 RepID=UPI001EFA2C4A|nr:OB-fold-containig protein [Nodularia sphaerocarpa]MDB9372179.1 DUF1449 family protein [Nodularia sphaerocarpa CS-585]MDB9376773.1 DUF1449 family protein [Nodularia sphaerocarpa CS-585A2]ULP72269.1 hypothetical protein BDGGKGIB_01908 [Nodularia sphaerocarpa UHCC 0038]